MSDISLIVIGAGRILASREELPETTGQRLFIEADPDLVDLARKEKGELIQAALGPSGDTRALRRYNLPRLSSLSEPADGLFELYPGLQDVESIAVDKLDPASLCERALKCAGRVRLVADAAGEENAVLAILDELRVSGRLDGAEFFVGERALYVGGLGAAELMSALSEREMDVSLRPSGSSDRLPRITASPRMPASRLVQAESNLAAAKEKLSEAQTELSAALQARTADRLALNREQSLRKDAEKALGSAKMRHEVELEATQTRLTENINQIERLRDDLDEKSAVIARHEQDLTSAKGTLEKLERAKKSLNEERNKTLREQSLRKDAEKALGSAKMRHEVELEATQTRLTENTNQIERLRDDLDEKSAVIARHEQDLTSAKGTLEKLERAKKSLSEERNKTRRLDRKIKKLEGQLEVLNKTLAGIRQDHRLAVRMQAVSQSDLNDMRVKYRQLAEAKARQDTLLDKLVFRLSEAGEYFEKLQMQGALSEDDAATAMKKS